MSDKEAGKIYVTISADTKALEEKLRAISETLGSLADRLAEIDRGPEARKDCHGKFHTGNYHCQECWNENKDIAASCMTETRK